MFAAMDISAMDSTSYGSTSSDSTVIDSEEDDRAFIEISELDKLLGLPPPRFDLSVAETDSIKVFDSAESNSNFDSDTDLTVPHKPGLPQRLKMDNGFETEVCYNKELEKVSVIKSELTIESDGQEVETECNSYLTEPVPVPVPPSSTDDMLYDRLPVRGCPQADSAVSKVLAKTDGNSIHLQCLQPCDISNQIPKNPATIPSPVLNKLKKLGTSVVVEQPASASHVSVCEAGENPKTENIHPGYLEIMESIDKAVDLTSDLTKKRKRAPKKTIKDQVPSLDKTLEQVENSNNGDNLAKFRFQVNISQIINISDQEKLYSCDICSGVYGRGFSLKRHYLRTHINHKHISKHDLHNCGIAVDPSVARGGAQKKKKAKDDSPPVVSNLSPPNDIPDLYRCHTCHQCFMLISDLKAHLMEHPPISVRNLAENNFKNYTCSKCDARYQNKKMFLRHQEMCQPKVPLAPEYFCLFCHLSFSSHKLQKLHQLQMHHPKKKIHQCYLCNTKIFKERSKVFKHLISHHSDDYFACFTCKLRVVNWEALKKHNRENHKHSNNVKPNQQNIVSTKDENKNENKVEENGRGNFTNHSNSGLTLKCTECPKIFASHLNMTRHRRLAHKELGDKKRKIVKKKENASIKNLNKRKTPTPPPKECVLPQPQPPDPDAVFYSCVALNVKENLTHHLDGKLDSQEILDYDLNKSITEQEPQVNVSMEEAKSIQPESAKSTISQHKERRSAPISPRVPWEKFNFPKNYDGRCGLTFMKDLSCLDIATQIIVKRNLARQESSSGKENNKESPANIPAGLSLVENNKMETDCAEAFGDPNNKNKDGESSLQLSGEWVWPHTYLCAACGYKSTNLWDTEDHKFALHPNVWVPHIEIVAEKSSEWDWFYHRRLPPGTEVEMTTPAIPVAPPPCSKCQRQCATTADLHRHMLDCGGDTTWMATMLPMASPGTRRRKWRPFGSRRRRQQGRRGLKRNIPNTPAKHSCGRIRTKPGDMDTIQKMIANLPAKRSTRRVIGEDADIKTRSQGTYNSVPISSVAVYSARGVKSSKVGKSSKINKKKLLQSEDIMKSKVMTIKNEPLDDITIKEENFENDFQPLDDENTIQHSDILASLQMMPVIRKNPTAVVLEKEDTLEEQPIETSKIIAAMREAMLDTKDKTEQKQIVKTSEKKKKIFKTDEKMKKTEFSNDGKKTEDNSSDLIICNGCGMQFDNLSACHRHKKKCVYWKEDKSSDENKTNRCTHCGSVFPYLMALLKHICNKLDVADEPAMPQLCPEQPVEEVQHNSVEDIPILSPAELSRDEVIAKRLSHIESVIKEVGSASFDLSIYHEKYFKTDSSVKDTPQQLQEGAEVSTKSKNNNAFDGTKEYYNENTIRSSKFNAIEASGKLPGTKKLVLNKSPSKNTSITKSHEEKQSNKNIKVSDIFKEVKKRRRKRQKGRVKLVQKVSGAKTGIRKGIKINSLSNLKKTIVKKKRSSNFTMLMKEWEKLEKEGAVGVGKRKRLLSHSDIYVQRTRTRRSLSSSINGADYLEIESLTTDTSSINDFIEYTPSKRLRQSNSINDIVQEIGQTKTELSSTESKRKETLENKLLGENKQCSDDVNEEKSSSSNVVVTKKKPGRHSAKSISEETEKHIIETIDSIVKRSGEDTNEPTTVNDSLYGSLSTKQCAKITSKDELAKQKTAEHIDQAIEDTINKSYLTIPDDIKWENVEEVIYNVSIGSSDVFKEENNEKTSSSTICHTKPVAKGRRGRRRKGIFKTLKSKSKIESKSNINNEFDKEQMKNVNEEGSTKLDGDHCSSDKSSITPEATDNQTVTNPLKNFFSFHSTSKTNRKLSYVEEDATNTNKPKELKTKQLSIADYINISHVAKRSSESPKQMRSDVTEIIENEKLLYKKNLTANETDQSVEASLASKNEDASTTVRPSIAVLANAIEKMIKKNSKQTEIKDEMHKNDSSIEDKPNSPISSSSTDDLALSVIRDKVIQKKRKKKFKLKKLLKNKCIDVIDRRNSKINKPRVLYKDERQLRIEKLKRKKKVKVGVSRNRWEVSVIENKTEQVEILYDEEKNKNSNCSIKSFYCSVCENKFDSSYLLYEHQLTHEHKSKCVEAERQNSSLDDSDAVKYCKSIGNIINDLEKRNPTKVVQVKQKANTEANETPLLEPTSSGTVRALEENRPVLPTQPVWQTPTQEWSSRSTTPLWEGHQNWEVDSFSTGNSLGSIMDTVNKLLSSDQEVSGSSVGYSWADLQLAMGASDEEMAMLEQLGEHSLQEEYVYDSSRPSAGGDWLPPEDNPTFTDLDHPEQSVTATLSQDVRKQEPLSDSEDSKSCRGVSRSPRRLHSDYESREMLCPTCGKHFLGLPALQTHVAWSHCVPVPSVPVANLPRLKRRALLSGEEIDRRLVCFVCKEIVSSASLLEAHIQAQHTKKSDQLEPSKPNLTESAERLKSKMSLALGGLVDKALNKLLGTGKSQPEPSTSQADLNSGALQLLGRLCAARKRDGSENMKLSTDIIQLLGRLRAVSHKEEWSNRAYNRALANEVRQILSRGKTIGVTKGALQASVNNSTSASDIKPTNLLDHLAVCSPDVQERPYACPICDLRFLIPSTRNRHIARAHGKYGRRYDEEVEESHGHDEIDNGWKDCGVEANDDEAGMLPMCSDCGLSFQSIQEVVQHRKEDHPRRFSADGFQEDVKPLCSEKQLLESSCEKVNQSQDTSKNDVNSLPVSDNAIDSTSTIKKKKGRPARLPESKTGENKKLSGLKNEISEEQANYKKQGRKNKQLCETTHPQENTSEDEEEHDNDSQVDSDSPNETSQEESTTTESNTPEIDKSADNLNSQQYNIHSSEENLADLTKKDRRKVSRMGNMAEEAVRVKAEAALRELNLARKSKSPSSNAKWGINAVKFTKQVSPSSPSNHPNGSPSKPRFLSLVDKKWKASTTTGLDVPKPELLDVKPDIYDFRDEDLCVNKKPFQQFKESSHQSSIVENSDSNKSMQSPNSNVTGSPRKTSNTSKTISDS